MENNNGRGIFYGVIGVATLIVAIIGATFAYFSATQTGNEFTTGAAEVGLDFEDVDDYLQSNLIPIETGFADNQQATQEGWNADTLASTFAKSDNVGFDTENENAFSCKDTAGYNICSIYEFTVSNPGTAPLPLEATMDITLTDLENLKYAVFRGTALEVNASTNGWAVNGNEVENTATTAAGSLILKAEDMPATGSHDFDGKLDVTLAANGTDGDEATYTIIFWVEEIGISQKSGGTFAGTVTLATSDGTGVTGQIVA